MRVLAMTLLAASVLLGLSTSANGHSSSLEWLTFNEVTLGGHKRVLSKHNIFPEESSYSPTRRQLAYVPYYADGFRSNRLWVADVDSAADRLLYEAPAWITDVAWSPDGKTIAFVSGGIWLIAPDGTNLRRVGEAGVMLAWSPDSNSLASARLDQGLRWYITVLSLDTGASRRVATGFRPRWSPDGTRLLFEYATSGQNQPLKIRVLDASGGQPRTVARGSFPSWSPDGHRIAFSRSSYTDSTTSLWIVQARGGTPRRLAQSSRGGGYETTLWSDDSHWIAFRRGARYCSSSLAVVRVDRSRPRRLASHTRIVTPLAWAANSRKVLYSGERCSNQ